jgi:peptide/nickel transport system substrate-binding protein/oligopeptide transport system substrate-binding protein
MMSSGKKLSARYLSLLICLIATLLTACGGGGTTTTQPNKPTKAPASQQVYRSPIVASDISTFDPGQGTDLNSIAAIDMVFTGLVQMNDQLKVQPQLAKSWLTSSDGLTWTFTLKSGLKFSDGTPLTAKDVVYSIDRALSPTIANLNGVSLIYLGLIKDSDKRTAGKVPTLINDSLLTPDDTTVVIKLNKATAYFLQALTYPTSYVVEKSVIDKWGLKWSDHLNDNGGQGGAGPFMVKSYDHATGIKFIPNPNYYGAKPQLQEVDFPFVKDNNTNYQLYQTGQVDNTLIPSQYLSGAMSKKDQFRRVPELWIYYYGMNYLVKPFDNIKIRQALELAINKDVLVHSIWKDRYVATNHIVPNGMPGYNQSLTGPDGKANTSGDTTLAKQLFAQGLQEEGLTAASFPVIKFTYSNTSPDAANEITTVLNMWQNVLGINSIKTDPVEPQKLFSEISNTTNNRTLALWRVDWIADYPDPQDWLTLQFDKGSPDNNMNYGQNSTADATTQQQVQQQLEQADVMNDQAARYQTYNKAEQQLVNDVAWLPVEQVALTYLLKPYVVGVIDNAQDLIPPDDWANVYIATH